MIETPSPPTVSPASAWDVPPPVLFNTWKHHAGALRRRLDACAGEADLAGLGRELVVLGHALMDLYTGSLLPADIARHVVAQLESEGRLAPEAFGAWVEQGGGYRMVTLPDKSEWVLRAGDETSRHVHLHPGRWVPHTLRVRANVLKTAMLALADARLSGGDPLALARINRVRRDHLGLAPLGRLRDGDTGIAELIDLLGAR
jgi:hypothetical protein